MDNDDWKILFPNCAKKIESAAQNGKKICFFTNQAGIERGKVDKKMFQKKVIAQRKPVLTTATTVEDV